MSSSVISRRAVGLAITTTAVVAATAPARSQVASLSSNTRALTTGNWLAQIKAQHVEIKRLLDAVKAAPAPQRSTQFKRFATLLTGHSIAEEVAIYPGIAIEGDQSGAMSLYDEQQMAKITVARIDDAITAGHDAEAMQLLGQLESALMAHVAEEENQRFPALLEKTPTAMNNKMTADFRQQFSRYMAG
jgi:hemerythrin superfamily protein